MLGCSGLIGRRSPTRRFTGRCTSYRVTPDGESSLLGYPTGCVPGGGRRLGQVPRARSKSAHLRRGLNGQSGRLPTRRSKITATSHPARLRRRRFPPPSPPKVSSQTGAASSPPPSPLYGSRLSSAEIIEARLYRVCEPQLSDMSPRLSQTLTLQHNDRICTCQNSNFRAESSQGHTARPSVEPQKGGFTHGAGYV